MRLNFVKLTNRWFADISNYSGNVMDLELVAGADEFLENISEGDRVVECLVSETPLEKPSYEFELIDVDNEGATYHCESIEQTIWLCNVTLFVFGYFPDNICFKVL